MKGKRKAAPSASANLVLSEAVDGSNDVEEARVEEGNVGEERGIDGDDIGENPEEAEGEEGDEDEDEEEGKGEGEEEAREERPKLDEGFFEIEAIRRKRVRKGQLQYLIKWRGWPETANTWEPLENLQSCSDVIEVFEESLRSGKSSRKRKRKYGGPHAQLKKKQQRPSSSYDVTGVEIIAVDKPLAPAPLSNSHLANIPASSQFTGSGHEGENSGDVNYVKSVKQADENCTMNDSKLIFERKKDSEYDPKLSELRGTVSTSDVNTDKLAIHFQEGKALEGGSPANGLPNVNSAEPVQNNRRAGAKRRKSGSVKRFKKDLVLCEPVFLQNSSSPVPVGSGGMHAILGIGNSSLTVSNSSYKPIGEDSINVPPITKILKPIGFSVNVLDDAQDVLVTFVAMRADGKEVIVDNRSLKANNPLLLINFYEQHLKYST